MKLKATKAWRITYADLAGMIVIGETVTVTTDYEITITGEVHNIQNAYLKIHIGAYSFAAIQFGDIRKLEAGDFLIEPYKEVE